MLFRKFTDRLKNASEETRFYRIVIAAQLVVMIVLAIQLSSAMNSSRTTLMPPEIKRSFWVSANDVSQEYLEEMAYWYSGLALTVTAQASEYQNSLFLKYADPAESGRLTTEAGARAEFLRKNSASTVFSARTIRSDMPSKRVAITGSLATYVADKRVSDRSVTYMIGFTYKNGMLYVSDFKETSDQDPFGVGATVGK